jgi:glycosyltransferase involved in cell wall biosynthesis
MNTQLFVSIIVPVYNGRRYLEQCLDALLESSYPFYEILVVDDASTDDSAEVARKKGATVLHLSQRSGPAAARNHGAQKARGDILFFVDADVVVQQETVSRVVNDFLENLNLAAVFGSYDDSPAENNFLSQYRNLYHHFVHQHASTEATTFWAGCGAIYRDIFLAVGGFDQNRYREPAIEDIELGYRLKRKGYHILLNKALQVKHLKLWKLGSLLRVDIFARAIPWSKLILERRQMINDLNLQISQRISSGLVGLSLAILPFSFFKPQLFYFITVSLAIIFALNHELYRFFLNRKGWKFLILAFPLHLFYYLYSGVAFSLCWGLQAFSRKR